MSVRQEMDAVVTSVYAALIAMIVMCVLGQVALNESLKREEAQRHAAVKKALVVKEKK